MSIIPRSLIRFEKDLRSTSDPHASIKNGVIGGDIEIDGPLGPKRMVYADYVASGRALRQVEDFVMTEVLPYYANSHTEQSLCGATMTQLREGARAVIADKCGADDSHAVIFSGSGATSGLNQLVHLFGIREAIARGAHVTVLHGPYEHHSNLLPWRESGAEVIEIAEGPKGGPDMDLLRDALAHSTARGPVITAFSAASNVTGVCTPIRPVTELVKSFGAKIVWDYAGGGPYLKMDMAEGMDAIVFSPHKFVGGPGASGVLIVRRDAVTATKPSRPGGGTVAFVNATVHDYTSNLEEREEGGTPNIVGDIRAALTLIVKDVIGQDAMDARNADLAARAIARWAGRPELMLLAEHRTDRLPILSFVPLDANGQPRDYKAFTTALSECFGIQARGGCSCAGPYVHQLMQIGDAWSARIRDEILAGDESDKPGFVRLNLSVLMDDATVDYILDSVLELARMDLARAA